LKCVFQNGATLGDPYSAGFVDSGARQQNNPGMTRPDAVRRVKSYSAATGYVFQYYFFEMNRLQHGVTAGTEYVYMVSAGGQPTHPLKILVEREAAEEWGRRAGRELTGTEEYAVAKMRLFQALDEKTELATEPGERWPELRVDRTNLDALLEVLGI
jgi:hypothetical protein